MNHNPVDVDEPVNKQLNDNRLNLNNSTATSAAKPPAAVDLTGSPDEDVNMYAPANQSQSQSMNPHTKAASKIVCDIATTEISPAKLQSVGIDPNDQSALFFRVSLSKKHYIDLSNLPRGKWGLNLIATLMSSTTMGLGIALPMIPKTMLIDSTAANLSPITALIDGCNANNKQWLNCAQPFPWNNESNIAALNNAKAMKTSMQSMTSGLELCTSWNEVLLPSSAITSADSDNESSRIAMILRLPNKHVATIIANQLLAWSALPFAMPEARATVDHILQNPELVSEDANPWFTKTNNKIVQQNKADI
ncbi:hypothetical protein HDU85_007243 [Gaertneriomyces sp. JEL0708]|nr:hypothetical protein HDU85_007243 [Gaertneriomyces sp. JEL0708]